MSPGGWGDADLGPPGRATGLGEGPEPVPNERPSLLGLAAAGRGIPLDQLRLPRKRNLPPIFGLTWFAAAFLAPLLLAVAYYGLIASKQYVVEYHFSVRAPLPDNSSSAPQSSNDAALLGRSVPTTGAVDTLENYTVVDYVRSAQAARDLDQRLNLRTLYANAGADPLSGLKPKASSEALARYWTKMVWSSYDPATGLAVVRLRAFRPADAYAIATNLIDLSSQVVNESGRQSRADSLRVAQRELDATNQRMTELRNRVTALRTDLNTIDPNRNVVSGEVSLVNTLRSSLASAKAQLAYLQGTLQDKNSPQLATLRKQIAASESQLAAVDQYASAVPRGKGTINPVQAVGEYEQLQAERVAVQALLFHTMELMQQASIGVEGQRLYLLTYVKPAVPETSVYPNRLQSILVVGLVSALVWLIGILVGKSVLDHVR